MLEPWFSMRKIRVTAERCDNLRNIKYPPTGDLAFGLGSPDCGKRKEFGNFDWTLINRTAVAVTLSITRAPKR
jgi:hypothetical protein